MRALLENKFCACNAENYREPTVTDRFPFEMLEFYCAALGIRLFDPDFS